MRRHFKSYKQLKHLNLIIIGCGMVMLLFLGFYMLDKTKQLEKQKSYSYAQLKAHYSLLDDDEVYRLLNDMLVLGYEQHDSMEFYKIHCFTMGHSRELRKFVRNLPNSLVNRKNKKFLASQYSSETLLWDPNRLKNCWFITPREYHQMNRSDTTDYWMEFRRVFGENGSNTYSKPIFNKDTTLAILEHHEHGGLQLGSAEFLVLAKENGHWRQTLEKALWAN